MSTLRIKTAEVFLPLLQPARYKGAYGGRGSGKSHFFAELTVEECLLNPGRRQVCIREVQKSLEHSAKQLIEDKIEYFGVQNRFRILNTHIEVKDGAGCSAGIIIFQGMQNHTAHSIKSLEGYDCAWVEEAQALSRRSLDLLRPTIRKPGSELWFSWNPEQPTDPVDEFLRRDRPDNAIVVRANYYDNPFFPDVLREDMEYDKRRDPDRYKHIWLGEYLKNSEARVFRNWRIGDLDEFDQDFDRFYFGGDFGFANDPTVLVKCAIKGRTLYVIAEAYKIGCDTDKIPFLWAGPKILKHAQEGLIKRRLQVTWESMSPEEQSWPGIEDCQKWPIVADSSRPETISYLQRHGFPKIRPSKKGAGSVEDGIEFLKSYDIVVHPSCVHVIDELSLYSYKKDPKTDEILPILEDKKNHVIDALRYALEPLRRAKAGLY